MDKLTSDVNALTALINTHLLILALTTKINSEGSAIYSEQKLVCSLLQPVIKVVTPMSLAAGGSVESIMKLTNVPSGSARDCYPIARSVVETMINASYVLACGTDVANQAIRHAKQKYHRDMDRTFGGGEYSLRLHAVGIEDRNLSEELATAILEFTSKKGREKNWTEKSVTERIFVVGDKLSDVVAYELLGAYAIVYGDASEITHGSLYGINLFFFGREKTPCSLSDFVDVTKNHVRGIYFALFFALSAFIRATCSVQKHQVLIDLVNIQTEKFKSILVDDQPII